jgi:hypothetical protein
MLRSTASSRRPTARSALPLARLAYGIGLLAAPGALIRFTSAHPADPRARRVARILGARHCVQAVLVGSARAPVVHELAVAVDVLHALSMEGLAVFDHTYRRAEILDGGVATAFASAQLLALRHPPKRLNAA